VDLVLKQLLSVKPKRVEISLQEACDYNKKVLKRIIPCCDIEVVKMMPKAFVERCREVLGSQSDLNLCHLANAISFNFLSYI
jgi:hypothetical protein